MLLSKFLDPKNDYAFKRIFGSERNKDILIHFLNDILLRGINPIEDVTFLKAHQNPRIASQRVSIVDILCQDTCGDRFIVEMQVAHEQNFAKRAQYYAAKAYIDQRGKGLDYKDLKHVTFLTILDFILFPDKAAYLSHHQTLDTATLEHNLKDSSFTFLELPKFNKPKDRLRSMIEKWSYFFSHANATNESELSNIVGDDGIIMRAYEELNRFSWSQDELLAYDSVDMKRWADQDVLNTAFQSGKEEGRQEGKSEAFTHVARTLKSQNMSLDDIVKLTNLSPEIIKRL